MIKYRKVLTILMCVSLGAMLLTACGAKEDAAPGSSLSEENVEEWVTLDENSPTKKYDPYQMLQEVYIEKSANGWEQISPSAYGLSDALTDVEKQWGYAILDLDGDGTEEFVIGLNNADRTQLVNVFTIDAEGALETLFCSDGTAFLSITEDGEWIVDNTETELIEVEYYGPDGSILDPDEVEVETYKDVSDEEAAALEAEGTPAEDIAEESDTEATDQEEVTVDLENVKWKIIELSAFK